VLDPVALAFEPGAQKADIVPVRIELPQGDGIGQTRQWSGAECQSGVGVPRTGEDAHLMDAFVIDANLSERPGTRRRTRLGRHCEPLTEDDLALAQTGMIIA
jgi:hypothetical protein